MAIGAMGVRGPPYLGHRCQFLPLAAFILHFLCPVPSKRYMFIAKLTDIFSLGLAQGESEPMALCTIVEHPPSIIIYLCVCVCGYFSF